PSPPKQPPPRSFASGRSCTQLAAEPPSSSKGAGRRHPPGAARRRMIPRSLPAGLSQIPRSSTAHSVDDGIVCPRRRRHQNGPTEKRLVLKFYHVRSSDFVKSHHKSRRQAGSARFNNSDIPRKLRSSFGVKISLNFPPDFQVKIGPKIIRAVYSKSPTRHPYRDGPARHLLFSNRSTTSLPRCNNLQSCNSSNHQPQRKDAIPTES
ncbi:hypothetical protein PspLS_07096, partial [Pyricularia sp. CBS 133598]